jgi:hypothetical protein
MLFVGSTAVLAAYDFLEEVNDVEVALFAPQRKKAAKRSAEKLNIPADWLNTEAESSPAYSSRLWDVAKKYKTYLNVLSVKVVTGEHLVAMKLRGATLFNANLQEVAGILWEHYKKYDAITADMIDEAVKFLYGGWEGFPEISIRFFESFFSSPDYDRLYMESSARGVFPLSLELEEIPDTDGWDEEDLKTVLGKAKAMSRQG